MEGGYLKITEARWVEAVNRAIEARRKLPKNYKRIKKEWEKQHKRTN